jgi:hypothetical protein
MSNIETNKIVSYINTDTYGEDFKNTLLTILNEIKEPLVCFVQNPEFIMADFDESKVESCLIEDPSMFSFSLNLNKHANFSKKYESPMKLVPLSETEDIVKWDWHLHYFSFGDPFILNGGVYITKDIKRLISKCDGEDLMDFENELQKFHTFPKNVMACFKEPIVQIKDTDQPLLEN